MERRSYRQYCGLARALDSVGDRWALLIVRELLVRPCRFVDLADGLPGIASNLLTKRLRQLEGDGVVERKLVGSPAEGVVYVLTGRGEELRPVIASLVRWSTPLMAAGRHGDPFRAGWLAVALPALLTGKPRRAVRIGLDVMPGTIVVEAGPDGIRCSLGQPGPVDAVLRLNPETALGLAAGLLSLPEAEGLGAQAEGDRSAIAAVFERSLVPRRPAFSPR